MINSTRVGSLAATAAGSIAVLALAIPVVSSSAVGSADAPKPTVVLVHGAWADSSSWSSVARRLQSDGYTVDVSPNPLRGLTSDSAYLADYLSTISGPIVLVGHSYGGAVITNAARGNANVKALVYVDAFIPDSDQTVLGLVGAHPGSHLADVDAVFNLVPYPAHRPAMPTCTSSRACSETRSRATRLGMPPRSWPPPRGRSHSAH